jgi:hypothetical protein
LGNPHLSIFQPITPLDAAPQRLYTLDKHFKAAADNHNTSGPSLYSRFYGPCRGGFCRGEVLLFEILRLQPILNTHRYLLQLQPFLRFYLQFTASDRFRPAFDILFQPFLSFYMDRFTIIVAAAKPFQPFLSFYRLRLWLLWVLSFSLVSCKFGCRFEASLYIHFIRNWVKSTRHSSASRKSGREKKRLERTPFFAVPLGVFRRCRVWAVVLVAVVGLRKSNVVSRLL